MAGTPRTGQPRLRDMVPRATSSSASTPAASELTGAGTVLGAGILTITTRSSGGDPVMDDGQIGLTAPRTTPRSSGTLPPCTARA